MILVRYAMSIKVNDDLFADPKGARLFCEVLLQRDGGLGRTCRSSAYGSIQRTIVSRVTANCDGSDDKKGERIVAEGCNLLGVKSAGVFAFTIVAERLAAGYLHRAAVADNAAKSDALTDGQGTTIVDACAA